MTSSLSRALAWPMALLTLAMAGPAPAGGEPGPGALTLDAAADLAVTDQPLLEGFTAQARAAREEAIAARQLPDPRLVAGIADLPIETRDAFSFTRDTGTQIQIGVMQELTRSAKRASRGELAEAGARRLEAERAMSRQAIRRDASLAWLELWRSGRILALTRASLDAARAQSQAMAIALRSGRNSQAEYLAARLDAERLQDAVSSAEQDIAHARNVLARWIGDAADRPVTAEPPVPPALPVLETVIERARNHPRVAVERARLEAAQSAVALAKTAYAPDWRVELEYANRPVYSDMVSVRIGVDLPLFTRERQDRGVAAALAMQDANDSALQDVLRQVEAEARLHHHNWEHDLRRLAFYDSEIQTQADARIASAVAGWRGGRGALREILDARRAALDVRLARLQLQYDLVRRVVELTYAGVFDTGTGADTQEIHHE
ncbi:MAG: TolC family protein [Gammaproteobacteria bacterium]